MNRLPDMIIIDFCEWLNHYINDQQKELLLGILKETSVAVKSGNEKQKQDNKKRFKDAICFMGDIGTKLISALSGLTNLLKYFNITPF